MRSGFTPIISAAMSRSRIAIQDRPMRPRTRFFATRANTATKAIATRYRIGGVALGPVTSTPNTARFGAVMVPDGA